MFCGKLHQNLSSCRPADCYLFQDDEYSFTLASSHRQTVSISPGKNSSRLSSGGSVQSSLGSGQLSDRSSPCCSSRVVLSHWSTSVQILCSHWWTPYYAGTKVYATTTHLHGMACYASNVHFALLCSSASYHLYVFRVVSGRRRATAP